MTECRPPVLPGICCQETPLSALRHRKLWAPLPSMAKYMALSGPRNALVIGCASYPFAGSFSCGSESVQVAPLSVEVAILNGTHSDMPRPPPKNRMVPLSFHNIPDWSL